ncbi:unnamed protein product [Cyclocybe aegerita]|uniref:NAD(P)-binding protein n=1 Tax=Cyclocybe aegerita TaxID=1973307 RepID=A0A8S0X1P0_CYCAE|nr:unnamed protein product [Cyclocybe aegerita]
MGNYSAYKFDPSTDVLDLTGKVAIVTGGNGGIGLETVRLLIRAGAKIYLGARSKARADECIAQLERESLGPGNGQVSWLKCDLSDPRDAKKVAQEFLEKEDRLDILVNNAGMISGPHVIGPDGVSTMAIVNYVSPYVFTRTLLPLLKKTAAEPNSDVRIVNVSSLQHKNVPSSVKFDDVSDFNTEYRWQPLAGLKRYGHSKLMFTMWSKTLQEQLNSSTSSITVISLHPGGVDTFSQKLPFPSFFAWVFGFFTVPPSVGAWTPVFAAAGKRIAENRGKYAGQYLEEFPTGTIKEVHSAVVDQRRRAVLERVTEGFLERIGI